ncbi:RNA-binding S4 domain-containing protein [Galbitalea sp. SE-J8]|uniref:RNA-binding S4 domain-containing protein n=1 Tax=Galbitalea sp. SE-J8 TaxID=3054952 RepID=UPI00259C7869|nr:RNA-binding S4 domain-containing protein [Galbitalea sp. SE-J8]MDM4763060.1 RNA-binding S4 domain-containing protein [Galbitalea sp. SE-J8]
MTGVRVDAWIWAVRVTKTRTAATDACKAGHVRVNGERAKPATPVAPGDEVRVRVAGSERTLRVAQLLAKRVGAPQAQAAYVDLTPAAPPRVERPATVTRDRGAGRPTKRERRDLERLRGRDLDS